MKKLVILIFLTCLLCPMQSYAAEKTGIYISPKLSWMFSNADMSLKGSSSGGVVTSSSKNHSDNGLGAALAIGYDFSSKFDLNFRTELEYAFYSKAKSTKSHFIPDNENGGEYAKLKSEINISTLFVNVYYDFKNHTNFTPYVGAGLGIAFVGLAGSIFGGEEDEYYVFSKNSNNNFAWNIGLGVGYAFNERISLDLGYRYSQLGDVTSKITSTDEDGVATVTEKGDNLSTHQIMLGVRFTF